MASASAYVPKGRGARTPRRHDSLFRLICFVGKAYQFAGAAEDIEKGRASPPRPSC